MSLIVMLLPCYDITIKVFEPGRSNEGGEISSALKESCPYCGENDCYFDCDMSQGNPEDEPELETEEQVGQRRQFNATMDGVEAMLLALACAGVDLDTPKICEAIETVVQAAENNIY